MGVAEFGFSTLKILATVKQTIATFDISSCFSTLKILATVKLLHVRENGERVLVPLRF